MKYKTDNKGFTLIEILVSIAVIVGIMFIIGNFSINILNFKNFLTPTFQVQQEIALTFQNMTSEIRSMSPSNTGSYAISQAGTSTLTFFSDIDEDGLYEQIRYFVSSSTLERGVTKPTGNPVVYSPANEKIFDVVHNVISTSTIFTYYDSTYTGTEAPMTYPLDISKIRIIGVDISVQNPNLNSPILFSAKLTPRNLRSN